MTTWLIDTPVTIRPNPSSVAVMNPFQVLRVLRRGPAVPAPYRQAWRHKPTFFGKLAMERWVAMSRSLPAELRILAELRAGSLVGCVW